MTGQGIEARIARLERDRSVGVTYYTLRDGTVKGIRSNRVLNAFFDACEGRDTPGARVMLMANREQEGAGRLHELAQSLVEDETSDETKG